MTIRLASLCLLLLPSLLCAQTADEPPPFARLDVAGPAAFRAAFLPTNLGALFASAEGERLWRPLLKPAEHIWRQWDGQGDGFAATRRRALDYAGRIRVFWMIRPGSGHDRDSISGVLALEMDGHTDLSLLAEDLARPLLARSTGEPRERDVGEHRLRLLGDDDRSGDLVTVPVLIGDHVVAFFGAADELEESVPRCLRALAADRSAPTAPVSLQLDLAQLKLLEGPREEPSLRRLLGLDALSMLHVAIRPNGPHAELAVDLQFTDGDRGLLAAFFPEVGELPGLLRRVPSAATPWLTVPFRADVMLHTILEMVAANEHRGGGVEATRNELRDELGVDLDTEILDQLGGEVMVIGDLWAPEDREHYRDGGDPPLGACVAFSLRDRAAFSRGFDKLLAHLKGVVNRFETRRVDGVEITRLGAAFLTGVHMAVGEDVFAMAFGEEGVAQLEGLVAGHAAGRRELPQAIQRVSHLAPAGWNGAGLANVRAILGGQVALVLDMLDETMPPGLGFDLSVDDVQDSLEQLLPLVERHGLEDLVTMTGHDHGAWRLRLVW